MVSAMGDIARNSMSDRPLDFKVIEKENWHVDLF
jgi:hypothetical protein